jgi:hypothetical protein
MVDIVEVVGVGGGSAGIDVAPLKVSASFEIFATELPRSASRYRLWMVRRGSEREHTKPRDRLSLLGNVFVSL